LFYYLKAIFFTACLSLSGLVLAVDTDRDGLPDDWETANGRKGARTHSQTTFDSDIANYQANEIPVITGPLSVIAAKLQVIAPSLKPLELDRRITSFTIQQLKSSHLIDESTIVRSNEKLFGVSHSMYDSSISLEETDSTPPSLNAITVDKTNVDVSESPKTITFIVDATDASGVDWGAGANQTSIVYQDAGGSYHWANGSDTDPGKLSIEVTSEDKGGTWTLSFLALTDISGNKSLFGSSTLQGLGLPGSIEVIGGVDATPPSLNAITVDKTNVDVSESPKTITFIVDATDASGVDWGAGANQTSIVYQDAGGSYHWANGSDTDPGKLSIEVTSEDKGGTWTLSFLALTDISGNKSLFYSSTLQGLGLPGSIEVIGGVEADPPLLLSISVDRLTLGPGIDSSTSNFNIEATDASGIDWDSPNTKITFQHANGDYAYADSSSENPGNFTFTFDSVTAKGSWDIKWLALMDTLGNFKNYYYDRLSDLGLPGFLYVLTEGEASGDIRLSATTESTALVEESESKFVLNLENIGDVETGTLDFALSSVNVSVDSIARANGSLACATSTLNYNSSVTCSMSSISAGSSINLILDVTAGVLGSASFNASIKDSIPDINYLDNNYYALLTVESDSDRDGIVNSMDTDDDGDGLTDTQEATYGTNPLLTDSDSDGFSDYDEIADGTDPLDANSVPMGGLSLTLIKAFLDKQKAEQ
ncbi:thrombospondin type 3 repeat-containing protein, partial [Porticoccaceae bacterium]|nr:thrombospondin type 3 repeat-containing protein [Porticoccaceae bacterium]